MGYPLTTPLGRMGVITEREDPALCIGSIPVSGLCNPLTGRPTIAPVALLVDHIGGLVNHLRRGPDEWTLSTELAIEFTPEAMDLIQATRAEPVVATGRPLGPKRPGLLSVCELTHGGRQIGTATVRSFHNHVPGHVVTWPDDSSDGTLPATLQDRLSVEIAESGGNATVLRQLDDPVVNNTLGIVHGGMSAAALELVANAALNTQPDRPMWTASLRVNFLRQFRGGRTARYEATVVRAGRNTGVADATAIGDDGSVALQARLTAYR